MPILSGKFDYPGNGSIETLESKVRTIVVDASQKAEELGNSKVMNIILWYHNKINAA